ncbi:MAG: thiamine phosphate synthase, partial [Sinobacteraceae bacterium]|nr:thiamine phosphate synthase [Nevskiaceae bacterium]
CPDLDDDAYAERAGRVSAECSARDVPLVVDRPAAVKGGINAVGLHLDGARLATCPARPLGHEYICLASVHNADELARAYALEMDAAVLSPLRATASHPGQAGLGNRAWQAMAHNAGLPVYALGGIGPDDLDKVRALGGFGVAGITAYFPAV